MHDHKNHREKEINLTLLVVASINLLLGIMKTTTGFVFGINSLLASGIDSFCDLGANFLTFITVKYSIRPADEGYPYGHHKFETLGSIFIGVILLMASFELAIGFIKTFNFRSTVIQTEYISVIVVIVSILASLFISRFELKRGKRLDSNILVADSMHTKSDFLMGIGVLISIVASKFGFIWIDSIVGLCICVVLFISSMKILKLNIPDLLDASPKLSKEVIDQIYSVDGILDVHKFRARGNKNAMYLDFHILLDEDLSLKKAHELAHDAEDKVKEFLASKVILLDVTVHIEPFELEHND